MPYGYSNINPINVSSRVFANPVILCILHKGKQIMQHGSVSWHNIELDAIITGCVSIQCISSHYDAWNCHIILTHREISRDRAVVTVLSCNRILSRMITTFDLSVRCLSLNLCLKSCYQSDIYRYEISTVLYVTFSFS